MKKIGKKSKVSKNQDAERETIRLGKGKFNFPNGDSYEGEYMVINKKEIYRQGYGVYKTYDEDEYHAVWDKDDIKSNFHVVYGNKAEYKGELDEEGAMSGKGTYTFPDGTSLTAIWRDNQPISDYVYVDPLGYKWHGKSSTNNQEIITFAPENRIWGDEKDPSTHLYSKELTK